MKRLRLQLVAIAVPMVTAIGQTPERGTLASTVSGTVFDSVGASVFVLRKKKPDAARPYRALGYPVLPGLFVLAAAIGIVSAYVAAPRTSLFGTGLLLAGVAVYFAFRKKQSVE